MCVCLSLHGIMGERGEGVRNYSSSLRITVEGGKKL